MNSELQSLFDEHHVADPARRALRYAFAYACAERTTPAGGRAPSNCWMY